MKTPTIGILGGMGPRATVTFEQRLLDALPGSDQSLPRIISINNGSIPDRTAFLRANGDDPVDAMIQDARALLALGAQIVCMPCNTAHAAQILNRLIREVPLPLIDMPAAALNRATALGLDSVLILSTEGTRYAQIYESRAVGVQCIWPTRAGQEAVNQVIARVKDGTADATCISALNNVIESTGCDGVILACTELSVVSSKLATVKHIIDAMDELILQCSLLIRAYTEGKECA